MAEIMFWFYQVTNACLRRVNREGISSVHELDPHVRGDVVERGNFVRPGAPCEELSGLNPAVLRVSPAGFFHRAPPVALETKQGHLQ